MYDYAHGQSDSIEGITHSICTLEFEDHRPLYDWFIEQLGIYHPQQIEFARLNLTYTVMSKRKLLQLVEDRHVTRLGRPAHADHLAACAGAATRPRRSATSASASASPRRTASIDIALLEHCVREDLNKRAPRVMAVLRPLKVVIDNYPEGQVEELDAVNNPEDPSPGTRKVPFSRVLYIEQDDFREDPPKKYFRLSPGREVRLRYAYFIKCTGVVKNDDRRGRRAALHLRPGDPRRQRPDGRKVKGTIHWVSAAHAVDGRGAALRHAVHARRIPDDGPEGQDFTANLNPNSLEMLTALQARAEPRGRAARATGTSSSAWATSASTRTRRRGKPVFNRTVALRDTWAKIEQKSHRAGASEPTAIDDGGKGCAMTILGIGGILSDAAAAILKNGVLVGAVEQRKLARRSRSGRLPEQAIHACLRAGRGEARRCGCVAIARPLAPGPENALHIELRDRFPNSRIVLVDHHTAHAASAYYPSGYSDATVLTLDRAGDFRCGARWRASGFQLSLDEELYYPDSLGDLYRRVTELLGFDPAADAHKVQWLSASGADGYTGLFLEILGMADGRQWPRIDRTFFDADRLAHGSFSPKFYDRLGLPDGAICPPTMRADVAAGAQRAFEQTVRRWPARERTSAWPAASR